MDLVDEIDVLEERDPFRLFVGSLGALRRVFFVFGRFFRCFSGAFGKRCSLWDERHWYTYFVASLEGGYSISLLNTLCLLGKKQVVNCFGVLLPSLKMTWCGLKTLVSQGNDFETMDFGHWRTVTLATTVLVEDQLELKERRDQLLTTKEEVEATQFGTLSEVSFMVNLLGSFAVELELVLFVSTCDPTKRPRIKFIYYLWSFFEISYWLSKS